nr:hypothetical protein [uncultured Psychroserpens sp.]
MIKNSTLKQNAIVFLIPLALLLTLVFLLKSNVFLANQSLLSTFITIDFIITIPIIYFLLIRKRNISNLTIAPFLILCVVVASYTIPTTHQDVLSLAKTWLIPIVGLSVLTFVVIKVRKAIHIYKKTANNHHDFYSALVETCQSLFPKTVAKLATNEIALIYYGFFNFKKATLQSNEFSNYKGSGILSTLGAIIFVVAIEMATVHILIAKWSTTLAWVLTILSFYSALQLIGIIRSVPKRPITIHDDYLQLRFGILSETHIPFDAIDHIKLASLSDFDKEKNTKTLSLLGELEHSNIVIHLNTPQQLNFIYGKPKSYTKLLLFVDDNQNFKAQVETHLQN